MEWSLRVLIILTAYFVGAVPFGLILARAFAGIDVRQQGSGNIGATNVARTAGRALGLVTLVLDVAKGAGPVLVSDRVLGQPDGVVALAGLGAVVGHVFPVYLRFRGGKGVATALGVFLAVSPVCVAVAAPVFGIAFAATRVVSAGSMASAVAVALAAALLDGRPAIVALALVLLVLVLARHAANILRIIRHTERGI